MDSSNQNYSLTNNKTTTSDDTSVNDMLVQERPTTIVYCRKCGNKMLLTDNFCPNCGLNVHDDDIYRYTNTNTNTQTQDKLSMEWWKFWEYFILPASMLLYFISIIKMLFIDQPNTVDPILYNFIVFIFIAITYCFFINRKNNMGFYIMVAYLVFSTLIGALVNTTFIEIFSDRMYSDEYLLVIFCILIVHTLAWFLPNYIYFKKRKNYFSIDKQK